MTKEMELQIFVEENIGKEYGDDFKFGSIILTTRYRGGVEGEYNHGIEVYFNAPQGLSFGLIAETESIESHVEFFKWICEEFVPELNKEIEKRKK